MRKRKRKRRNPRVLMTRNLLKIQTRRELMLASNRMHQNRKQVRVRIIEEHYIIITFEERNPNFVLIALHFACRKI